MVEDSTLNAAGAGGTAERVIDVTNVSSVSVSVGEFSGVSTNYSGWEVTVIHHRLEDTGSASGGYGANCRRSMLVVLVETAQVAT